MIYSMGGDLSICFSDCDLHITPCSSMLIHSVEEQERANDGQIGMHNPSSDCLIYLNLILNLS